MTEVRLTPQAELDIDGILIFGLRHWGPLQVGRYSRLLDAAFETLSSEPLAPFSSAREAIRPGVRSLHVKHAGANAAHVIFYTWSPEEDLVTVIRVLHESADFKRHL